MGIISHPDRKSTWNKDIYLYVSGIPTDNEKEWDIIAPELLLSIGDTVKLNEFTIILDKVISVEEGKKFSNTDLVAKLNLSIITSTDTIVTSPSFMIDSRNNRILNIDSYIENLGLRFSFLSAIPDKNKVAIQVLKEKEKPDYVIIKALKKPYISLLWLGTLLTSIGFALAIYRRVKDNK
jgi:cytochrome c-type biogenesis protein CcmF